MRPGTDACPVGTRGVAGLASRQYRVPCLSARRRRGAATRAVSTPVVALLAARRETRSRPAARRTTTSCLLRETLRTDTVDDAEVAAVARQRAADAEGQAAHWRDIINQLPALPPCGVVWLRDGVGQWRGGVGGFSRVLASLLGASCREYVHFSKTYLEAPRSKLCKTPLDIVPTRARSGMGAGSGFKNLVGLSTLDK